MNKKKYKKGAGNLKYNTIKINGQRKDQRSRDQVEAKVKEADLVVPHLRGSSVRPRREVLQHLLP